MSDDPGDDAVDCHWWQGPLICAVCSHAFRAVRPIPREEDQPADGSECPKCHSMSCVIAQFDDDE